MAELQQNYKDHARWLPAFHFFVIPVLLANVLNAVRHLYLDPVRSTVFALVVALALLTLGLLSRTMTLTVQDRVIRLGDAPAAARVPARGSARPHRRSHAQAARSGAALCGRRRDGGPGARSAGRRAADRQDIKLRVKNWQPDFLRVRHRTAMWRSISGFGGSSASWKPSVRSPGAFGGIWQSPRRSGRPRPS